MPPSTPKSKATPRLPSSVSTSILFDSPALHALKRAQLVQLCKRHNVKASGKNVELVERLKRCAEAMKMGVEVDASPYKGGMGGEEGEEDAAGGPGELVAERVPGGGGVGEAAAVGEELLDLS